MGVRLPPPAPTYAAAQLRLANHPRILVGEAAKAVTPVARMARSEMRDARSRGRPGFAFAHPGYILSCAGRDGRRAAGVPFWGAIVAKNIYKSVTYMVNAERGM